MPLPTASPPARRPDAHWQQGRSWPALGLIVGLHAGGLWALMQLDSVREAVQEAVPIMVGLITLPPPEPPKVEPPPPPPPRPAPPRPRPEPAMIAAPSPEPAPMVAPPPDPVPEPVEPQPPPPPAPPAAVVPPNFLAAYLDNPAPSYPPSSKRLRETGMVMLRVLVNPLGRPDSVEVERSSGYSRLDRAALDAVRKWKFVPAKQGDQPISAWVLVPLNFELKTS